MRSLLCILVLGFGCSDTSGTSVVQIGGEMGGAPPVETPQCEVALNCLDCNGHHIMGQCVNGEYECPNMNCGPNLGTGGAPDPFATSSSTMVTTGVGGAL